MKAGILLLVVTLVILGTITHSQISAQPVSFIDQPFLQPYKKCCNTHYIFSVDVSGSILPWTSTNQAIITGWKGWLSTGWGNLYVSSHRFSTIDHGWIGPSIRTYPILWGPPSLLIGGTTNYNQAINFLASQLSTDSRQDNICYTLITDNPLSSISVSSTTQVNFQYVYERWKRRGCVLCFRVINVRELPKEQVNFQVRAQPDQQASRSFVGNLASILSNLGIYWQQFTPKTIQQVQQLYQCRCKGFAQQIHF